MWGMTTIVMAFVLALAVAALGFFGGAVIVAIPVALVVIAMVGLLDFNRRRRQAQTLEDYRRQARSEKVDFTPRDEETLVSE
jgi:choline-glycine betaine transporter